MSAWGLWTIFLALAVAQPAIAQQRANEHEQHHPVPPTPATIAPTGGTSRQAEPPAQTAPTSQAPSATTSPAAPSAAPGMSAMGMGGMPTMMQQMMRNMMGLPVKPLYPTMMASPLLDQNQRLELLDQARQRIQRGTAMIEKAQLQIRAPTADANPALWVNASANLREGLRLVDSGVSARTALEGSDPPAEIALAWFRSELGLTPRAGSNANGLLGSGSTFHVIAMTGLIGFGLLALAIWWRRSRRVSALLSILQERTLAPAATGRMTAPPSAPDGVTTPGHADGVQLHQSMAPDSPQVREARVASWRGSLRVGAIFQETPSIRTFRLVDPGGHSIPFDFLPGQFLWINLPSASGSLRRSYTIASSPTQHDFVEITVKQEDKGVVSTLLHSKVIVGDLIEVEAPRGYLTFTGLEANSIVMIGGGVGATPLMAVLRYLTDRAWQGEIFYLYSCRTSADFVFRDEIEQLQRRHANLRVLATMTRAAGTVWIGPEGRLTKDLIAQFVPRIAKARVHLCGPEPMMVEMRRILEELGVSKGQLKTEAFGTAKRAAVAMPREPVAASSAALAMATFTRSAKTTPLLPGMSVLEAAEGAGVFIENSCRSGTCGSCKVRLLSGRVTMAVEDALEPAEKAQGWILACQAQSNTDVAIEA